MQYFRYLVLALTEETTSSSNSFTKSNIKQTFKIHIILSKECGMCVTEEVLVDDPLVDLWPVDKQSEREVSPVEAKEIDK